MALYGGIGAALVIGGVAGLYPSMRAARLSPTEALRTRMSPVTILAIHGADPARPSSAVASPSWPRRTISIRTQVAQSNQYMKELEHDDELFPTVERTCSARHRVRNRPGRNVRGLALLTSRKLGQEQRRRVRVNTTTVPVGSPTKLLDEWAVCMRSHGDPGQVDPTVDASLGNSDHIGMGRWVARPKMARAAPISSAAQTALGGGTSSRRRTKRPP